MEIFVLLSLAVLMSPFMIVFTEGIINFVGQTN